MPDKILLIGCGNMGFAMLRGWLAQDVTPDVHVVEPAQALRTRAQDSGAHAVVDISALPETLAPDLVVLAVKPQQINEALARCGAFARQGACIVSVAAGVTIGTMAAQLPDGTAVIRCMPNTPAAIGEGAMALCPGRAVTKEMCDLAETLFSVSGAVAWIRDERLMDAVTAISGSGPAYVFHFIEALAEAGRQLGLPDATAALLARQTVAGAGKMALISGSSPGELRQQVTSPGGTTAAALKVLMHDDRLTNLVVQAATAACDRGAELGRTNQNQTPGKEQS